MFFAKMKFPQSGKEFSIFLKYKWDKVQLTYNIVLVSGVQQSDSVL